MYQIPKKKGKKQMMKPKVLKRIGVISLISLLVLSMSLALCISTFKETASAASGQSSYVSLSKQDINTNKEKYYDNSVIYKLPSTVKDTDEISLIIDVKHSTLLDAYKKCSNDMSFAEYAATDDAKKITEGIRDTQSTLLAELNKAQINYKSGAFYTTVLSGFEIKIQASDFESTCKLLGDRVNVIVGETYNVAETQLVENDVNVFDTGIFDTTNFPFDGTGMVVAVLDTGVDYGHTAFSLANFAADRSKLGLTKEDVAALMASKSFAAEELYSGLTVEDVYYNEKIPYQFDYADYDPDVFPIKSNHGTHVSGIIAGKDNTITGVAPNAQLVEMKIFSDVYDTAISSWILTALEDCVYLGVDVINMSLGTSCGFSREMDKDAMSDVYDNIRDAGISLIVAASNSYNSTYGSDKNGNLGLTSNPDSATVGSPSTYEGALSIASISGTKTPYFLYNDTIMYFTEANDKVSKEKSFLNDILPAGVDELEIEYVTIPGVGRSADYAGFDVTGKIALVKRGDTTFEEKANAAQRNGAAGIIIYNNVSGEIKISVGDATLAVCSMSQDDGEMLAEAKTGKIKISRSQTSGPFMSDYSSWGPTPDLKIKPELTAHGGSILSAVPGNAYDRMSGTSMAAPNMAGATALLRQYIINKFPSMANDMSEISKMVNRLFMSTADIVMNTNGLPYSVRKQGAGLASIDNSAATNAYIISYDSNGNAMDKTKIELGDDPKKIGVYSLSFSVCNFGSETLTYDMYAYVMTEGVSDTKTNHGNTTVTEKAYILDGAKIEFTSGNISNSNLLTVPAGKTVDVTVKITLSDSDKAYLDSSFENGMYVEGFICLGAKEENSVDLNVPYLAFYGDWTVAPLFDIDYFETDKDEQDDSISLLDKTLPDAYASRPIGGLSGDYMSYLGSYYFIQNPSATKIAADRKYISISNQEDTVNSLRFVWMGMLRNAAKLEITITDDATGEVAYSITQDGIRKSYGDGGSIYPANVEIEFDAMEQNLKNNASYTVRIQGYLDDGNDDYSDGGNGIDTNLNNVFEFPLVADFEAPAVTGCEFYTEYDKTAKKTRLYAKLAVYDNHYAMSMQVGYIKSETNADGDQELSLESFDEYLTPVYSEGNSTTYVVYELTDHIYKIKQNSYNKNTFTVACYDYALNLASYEIALPDEFIDLYFEQSNVTLSPNEIYDLKPLVYPSTEWPELLEYTVTVPPTGEVARIVNNKLVAIAPGTCQVIATSPTIDQTTGKPKRASFTLTVLGEGDEGYVKYDKTVAENFSLTGYYVDKAYYIINTADREIGSTGENMIFVGSNYALRMYPSESVTLQYKLDAYYPDDTKVVFQSSNDDIVTVDENGRITAVAEGYASISVTVTLDGKSTYYSQSVSIEVMNPFINSGPYLSHYYGNGGTVVFPEDLAITAINQFAFSNYNYIPKDTEAGDVINDDFPDLTKMWFIGDNTITKVIIPNGVESIGTYAFAGLTALEEVVFPSSLTTIDQGAFYGCTSLKKISYMDENGKITSGNGLTHVKLINQDAFKDTALAGDYTFDSIAAIAASAFKNSKLNNITLGKYAVSIGNNAFENNTKLSTFTILSEKIKLGTYAFSGCSSLKKISVNTDVIPTGLFSGAKKLEEVTLGESISSIGEYAFANTSVSKITISGNNTIFNVKDNYITNSTGDTLVLVFPSVKGDFTLNDSKITRIGAGAFSGNVNIKSVTIPSVKHIDAYAFAGCTKLSSYSFGELETVGNYSFYQTIVKSLPSLDKVSVIGDYAFAETRLLEVTIPSNTTIGAYAFADCRMLSSVVIGDNVNVGDYAFSLSNKRNYEVIKGEDGNYRYKFTSPMSSLTIGKNAVIGDHAFAGAHKLTEISLGANANIGDYAFYNNSSLERIDLSKATSIGEYAFSGDGYYLYSDEACQSPVISADRTSYEYVYYASKLEAIDLSSVESLGENAFSACKSLKSVKFGNKIDSVPERAFLLCTSLESANLEGMKTIESNAFSQTGLKEIDLSSATCIGSYAFSYCDSLTSVTFKSDAITVEEGAFSYSGSLANVVGMNKIEYVGDYSFGYTSIMKADLSGAEYVGTQAFIKDTRTEGFTVVLGKDIKTIGDNPFAHCIIAPLFTNETITFSGKDYTIPTYTYDINDSIKVINGSIYYVVPNGIELITYAGDAVTESVADGTVRISAYAFASSDIENVILPYTVKSIGHKAFYDCRSLSSVTFTSYTAPILEEEYDYLYYVTFDNIPAAGEYGFYDFDGVTEITKNGLDIIPYYMWNVTAQPSDYYYGANFVDYIGHADGTLMMIRPANGNHYETFIFNQYFDKFIDGANAADDATLAVIAAINALPDSVSLNDKSAVEAARALYDGISTVEQQALITNITVLTSAERRISDLEYLASGGADNPETPSEGEQEQPTEGNTEASSEAEDNGNKDLSVKSVIIITAISTLAAVAVIAAIITAVVLGMRRKKNSPTPPTDTDPLQDGNETETAEETTESEDNSADSSDAPTGDTADTNDTVETDNSNESTDTNNETSADNAEVSDAENSESGEHTDEENT